MVTHLKRRLLKTCLAFSLLTLSFIGLSCTGYLSSTVFPSYLQRADKTVNFSNIFELSNLKGRSFDSISIKGFFLSTASQSTGTLSSEQVIGIALRFSKKEQEDVLLFFTPDLQFLRSYTRSDLGLPYGYTLSPLFSEAFGGRVLVGYTYEGENPTLQAQLVALDPLGREPPILKTVSDTSLLTFQGGVVNTQSGNEGTWLAQTAGNNVHFLLVPTNFNPPPPTSGNYVQAFDSFFSPSFGVSWYVKDPVRKLTAIGLRMYQEDKTSYAVFNLPENPGVIPNFPPLVSPWAYPIATDQRSRWVELRRAYRDDFFFYTVEGIALVQEDDPWKFYPFKPISSTSLLAEWTGTVKEGPYIRPTEDFSFYFTLDGRWFYVFDSKNLQITRSRTWW